MYVIYFRLAFDAYKNELTSLNLRPRTANIIAKQATAQAKFEVNKASYEQLRDDVTIKLKFLDENRVSCSHLSFLMYNFSQGKRQLKENKTPKYAKYHFVVACLSCAIYKKHHYKFEASISLSAD